ncbi:MAG: hypothetical protein LUH02_02130 [Erysipelotrichaceae bacterium]|nr:hypothetical protein [Erysipelotrichaceae bacterium]
MIIYDHAKIDNGVMGKIKYEYTETGRNYDNISQAQLNLIKKKIEKMKEDSDLSNIMLIYPDTKYHDNDHTLNNFVSLLFDTNITPQQKKLLFEHKHGIIMSEETTLEVGSMCNMSGFMKKQGKLEDARNIMETLSLTLDQALDALKIDEYDRPWFIDYLSDDED